MTADAYEPPICDACGRLLDGGAQGDLCSTCARVLTFGAPEPEPELVAEAVAGRKLVSAERWAQLRGEAPAAAAGVSSPEPEAGWLDGAPMDPLAVPAEALPPMAGYPFLPASGGACALLTSPTGAGKSEFAQACAYDAAWHGIRTAYLGHEVSGTEFNARAAILADARGDQIDESLREQLGRVRYLDAVPTLERAWAASEAWVAGVVGAYDVLILDPLSAVESALALNFEQSNHDYIAFHDRIVQPLVARGVRVVLLDNIGHALEARSRAKGASAKQDRADLTFSCSPSASPAGLIVRAQKIRSARAPHRRGDEWIFHRGSRLIEKRAASADAAETTFRPTVLMQRVSEELERAGVLSKGAVRRNVTGRNEYKDAALDLLVRDGYVARDRDGYRSLKPFRDSDPAPHPAQRGIAALPIMPEAAPQPAPAPEGSPAHPAFNKGQGAGCTEPSSGTASSDLGGYPNICVCADGGEGDGERCERCWGWQVEL